MAGWDAATGGPAWVPWTPALPLVAAPEIVDLDGDDRGEALVEQVEPGVKLTRVLVAMDLATGKERWRRILETVPRALESEARRVGRTLHEVQDLDGDGRREVVLACSEAL